MSSELFKLMINGYQIDLKLPLMEILRMCKYLSNYTVTD